LARIGVISDTHGLLRPEATAFLRRSDFLIHAGDIGDAAILKDLAAIAPLTAVRGNNDKGAWAAKLPLWLALEFAGVAIDVLHDVKEMGIEPSAAGFRVVIAGHSHKPLITERDGVLFVNPGSAGPRRFSLPVTVGYLTVAAGEASAVIKPLL